MVSQERKITKFMSEYCNRVPKPKYITMSRVCKIREINRVENTENNERLKKEGHNNFTEKVNSITNITIEKEEVMDESFTEKKKIHSYFEDILAELQAKKGK